MGPVCQICNEPLGASSVTFGAFKKPFLTVHEGECAEKVRQGARGVRRFALGFLGKWIEKKAPAVYRILKTAYEVHHVEP